MTLVVLQYGRRRSSTGGRSLRDRRVAAITAAVAGVTVRLDIASGGMLLLLLLLDILLRARHIVGPLHVGHLKCGDALPARPPLWPRQ